MVIPGLITAFTIALSLTQSKVYVEPSGAFAVRIPNHWYYSRSLIEPAGSSIAFSTGRLADIEVTVLVVPIEAPPDKASIALIAEQLFADTFTEATSEGIVKSEKRYESSIGGKPAHLYELVWDSDEEGPKRSRNYVLAAEKHIFMISIFGNPADVAGFYVGEAVADTFKAEARQPGTLLANDGGL